jgi:hypothetical protein
VEPVIGQIKHATGFSQFRLHDHLPLECLAIALLQGNLILRFLLLVHILPSFPVRVLQGETINGEPRQVMAGLSNAGEEVNNSATAS